MEELLRKLEDWMEAKRQLNECYEDCESSTGYFCFNQAEEEQKAREELDKAFERYIRQKVRDALAPEPEQKVNY